MIKGDTTKLILDYELDGTPLEDVASGTIADLWFQVNPEGDDGAISFKLSTNTINPPDASNPKYFITLTQAQSLALPKTLRYQLSVKLTAGGVFSSGIESITRGELERTSQV